MGQDKASKVAWPSFLPSFLAGAGKALPLSLSSSSSSSSSTTLLNGHSLQMADWHTFAITVNDRKIP